MGFINYKKVVAEITQLRALGGDAELEEAHRLERELEEAADELQGIARGVRANEPDAAPSTPVEGTPVPTPEPPPLPDSPQAAEQPPSAEQRLADAPSQARPQPTPPPEG